MKNLSAIVNPDASGQRSPLLNYIGRLLLSQLADRNDKVTTVGFFKASYK